MILIHLENSADFEIISESCSTPQFPGIKVEIRQSPPKQQLIYLQIVFVVFQLFCDFLRKCQLFTHSSAVHLLIQIACFFCFFFLLTQF